VNRIIITGKNQDLPKDLFQRLALEWPQKNLPQVIKGGY
jgi:hypothetical protein